MTGPSYDDAGTEGFIRSGEYRCRRSAVCAGVLSAGPSPDREEADTLKTRLGKIMIGTAIGAGALGVGFGASMAVASAATTHTSSATSSSSGASTTAVNAGSASSAATPSPAPSVTHKATHNCPNMGGSRGNMRGAPGSASTGS